MVVRVALFIPPAYEATYSEERTFFMGMGQKGWAGRERDGAFSRNVGSLLDRRVYSYVKWKMGDG
jgi:hypothetical protein